MVDFKSEIQGIETGRERTTKGDRTGVTLYDRSLMRHSHSLISLSYYIFT